MEAVKKLFVELESALSGVDDKYERREIFSPTMGKIVFFIASTNKEGGCKLPDEIIAVAKRADNILKRRELIFHSAEVEDTLDMAKEKMSGIDRQLLTHYEIIWGHMVHYFAEMFPGKGAPSAPTELENEAIPAKTIFSRLRSFLKSLIGK